MMKARMNEALNRQINEEAFSSYLYLSMSAWFESQNLKGFANWMKVQAQEEAVHAKIFFSHIVETGGRRPPWRRSWTPWSTRSTARPASTA